MKIYLAFADPISEAYRKKLQTFLDAILAEGLTKNRPPIICFTGMNRGTYDEIMDIHYAYYDRYGA